MTDTREDRNHRDIVTLREYFESRLNAIKDTMAATDKTMAIRLEQMNELREQINTERTRYISREEHSATHKSLDNDIRSLRESRAELAGKASMASVYATGMIAILSLLIGIGGLLYQVVR